MIISYRNAIQLTHEYLLQDYNYRGELSKEKETQLLSKAYEFWKEIVESAKEFSNEGWIPICFRAREEFSSKIDDETDQAFERWFVFKMVRNSLGYNEFIGDDSRITVVKVNFQWNPYNEIL